MSVVIFIEKNYIFGAFYSLFVLFVIQKTINTVYTITQERTLIISQGWLSKKKVIPIDEIMLVDEMYTFKIFFIATTKFILIKHNNNYYSLLPENQVEFLELLNISK
jgi:Protein of unknown function (DUF1200).